MRRERKLRTVAAWAAVILVGLPAALAVPGCASVGVKPWERDILAAPGMQVDPDPLVTALDEHIYFSKEASTGGLGTAGGGCGCN